MKLDTILNNTGAHCVSLNVNEYGWEVMIHIHYADGTTGMISARASGLVKGTTLTTDADGVMSAAIQDTVNADDRASVLAAVATFGLSL